MTGASAAGKRGIPSTASVCRESVGTRKPTGASVRSKRSARVRVRNRPGHPNRDDGAERSRRDFNRCARLGLHRVS